MNINTKVLLIDDDEITNFINVSLLRNLHFTDIQVAVNGEEGLKHILECDQTSTPTIIFLDINMPVMNGFEFLERYNEVNFENRDKFHVVMLSTTSNDSDIKKIKNLGLNLIHKPLTKEKVFSYINEKALPNAF